MDAFNILLKIGETSNCGKGNVRWRGKSTIGAASEWGCLREIKFISKRMRKMSYNSEFEDKMDSINNTAQGYGFKNGVDWANAAQKAGDLSWGDFKKFENIHNLRVRFSHGNARDISISYETISLVRSFERMINRSDIRKNRGGGKKMPKLPEGTFRGKPYIKEFKRTGKDGEEYLFKFAIYREENYLDDGNGGATGFGYFIHIEKAPYWNYAKDRLHEFHLIRCKYEYHICWNKIIDSFEEANAVMYVWVNRYADLLDVLKKDKSISESELVRKANRRSVLPAGTFRYSYNRKNNKKSKREKKTVHISRAVYDSIMNVLGCEKPELGGMLGYTKQQDYIDTFVFDVNAHVDYAEYTPNVDYLNQVLEDDWYENEINLAGFVHSHPGDFNRLSYADIEYAQRIMNAFNIDSIFMPIVTSSYSYKASITGYIVKRNGNIESVKIKVVDDQNLSNDQHEDVIDPVLLAMVESGFASMDKKYQESNVSTATSNVDVLSQDYTFARIANVLDIDYMGSCSIIGIGCGGARGFYEDMARMGVANFFLMDGDVATYSNIASQNGYISEVGMRKPELIKKRLLDINADVKVHCFNEMLSDDLADEYIEREILSKCDFKKAVICAFTDDFYAQARISRIALKYKIPFISAEHHAEGATSELIFWYPGITKYSRREIAKSRYEAFQNGFKNDVTSVGSPIYNTTRLNGLCEKIALGLLVYAHDPNHESCAFLRKKADYNLILIKQKYISEENDCVGEKNGRGQTRRKI